MNLNRKFAGALLVGSLLFTSCAENPADKVPAATVAKTPTSAISGTPAPAAPAVVGTVYAFNEGTEVGFVGSKVTGSHSGGFKSVNGMVTVPEDSLDKAVVELTISMGSLYSDDEKLTGHLKDEDFFAVETHKECTFKSTSLTKTDAGYDVKGDLTLRGVTKSIQFPATIAVDGDSLKTSAEFAINRKDFGIEYTGKKDDLIRDEVVIKYDITATKKA